MKVKTFCVTLVVVVMSFISFAYAFERHPNGWVYPMNRQPTNEEWSSWHSYATHVGHDYMQSAGKSVHAIADGWIEAWSDSLPYYGSKSGAEGSAVLLGHRAIDESGKKVIFYAVYGHNKIMANFRKKGKLVRAGETFAITHNYYYNSNRADHIHLGIRPNEVECCGKQFRGFSSDGKDHGWVDPKVFLNTHSPKVEQAQPPKEDVSDIELCYDLPQPEEQLSGWAWFWKKVRSFFWSYADAAGPCNTHKSIEGALSVNDTDTPNCSKESFVIAQKPAVMLHTNGISIVRKSSVQAGKKYGLGAYAWNSGESKPYKDYRMRYAINIGGTWHNIDGDTLTPDEMMPGAAPLWEQMNHDDARAPSTPGTYAIRACIDGMPQSCSYGELTVTSPPRPDVVVKSLTVNNVVKGSTLKIRYQLRNNGTKVLKGQLCTLVKLFRGSSLVYAKNQCINESTFHPGHQRPGALDIGTSGFTPGSYRVRVETNSNRAIAESNTANNVKEISLTITAPPVGEIVQTMRFYHIHFGAHLYSVHAADISGLPAKWPDWHYAGRSFKAFTQQRSGTVPIYACWTSFNSHRYSPSWSYAKQNCQENPWVAFYGYPGPGPGRKPIRELWHPRGQSFIYANGEADADFLVRRWGFVKHGIAWYAPL